MENIYIYIYIERKGDKEKKENKYARLIQVVYEALYTLKIIYKVKSTVGNAKKERTRGKNITGLKIKFIKKKEKRKKKEKSKRKGKLCRTAKAQCRGRGL